VPVTDALADLPDDVREAIKPHVDAPPTVLAAIGVQIAARREEAKGARQSSGIESTWRECEEAYLGIDDANRHEFTDARWAKPMSMDGPVTTGRRSKQTDHRSTVFLRLTSRYVDAGVAKLTEILLPADDKAFSFNEMPVPELIAASEDESQVVHSGMGEPLTRPLRPGETPPAAPPSPPPSPDGSAAPAAPQAPPRVPLTVKDLAIEKIEMARKRAKAAETRVYDWMTQTQYRAEIRKVINDAARIGVGVLKAPTPVSKRVMAIKETPDGGVDLIIKESIVPASVWVDPWDIFPDPACGENIHNGDFIFERDHMSTRQVRGLKKLPGYIGAQIDKVLEEGPNKINLDAADRSASAQKNRFEVWYFYGSLTRDEIVAIDQAAGNAPSQSGEAPEEAHAIVTLINDSVVRATINPLDSGSFPYHSMPWQRRAKHWAGVGVAEQMRTPQKITNAALRALLNNAGKSAGSQLVINQSPGGRKLGDHAGQDLADHHGGAYRREAGVYGGSGSERHAAVDGDHHPWRAVRGRDHIHPADCARPVRRHDAGHFRCGATPEQQRQPVTAIDRVCLRRLHYGASGSPILRVATPRPGRPERRERRVPDRCAWLNRAG
jgi:hypothetical protein